MAAAKTPPRARPRQSKVTPAVRRLGPARHHRASGAGRWHGDRRPGLWRRGRRGRRSLLQHRHDRLSGSADRSVLRGADRHLHLPAYRQCRHQRRRHRDDQPRSLCRRSSAASSRRRSPTPPTTAPPSTSTKWLKARDIIGMSGIDTRALTALIREKGMPNGVIAHNSKGKFDIARP